MVIYRVEELLPPGSQPRDGNWNLILETQDEDEAHRVFHQCVSHTGTPLRVRRCFFQQDIVAWAGGSSPPPSADIRTLIDLGRI